MNHIAVGVGSSSAADAAVGWATEIAGKAGASLVAVRAIPERLNELPLDRRREIKDAVGGELESWVAPAVEAGVEVAPDRCFGAFGGEPAGFEVGAVIGGHAGEEFGDPFGFLFGILDIDRRRAGSNVEEDGALYNSLVYLDPDRETDLLNEKPPTQISRSLRGPRAAFEPESVILPSVNASPKKFKPFIYDKARLLPFGETVPFASLLPFVKRFVETRGGGAFSSGTAGAILETPFGDLGPLICFESTYPGLARRAVVNGAALLVNVTNDAWFLKTAAARQHALQSRFRAIETGRAVVRVANTGLSRVYLPNGTVRGTLAWWEQGAETVKVPLYSHLTFQTRVGDWFGWLCLTCLAIMLTLARTSPTLAPLDEPSGESADESVG